MIDVSRPNTTKVLQKYMENIHEIHYAEE